MTECLHTFMGTYSTSLSFFRCLTPTFDGMDGRYKLNSCVSFRSSLHVPTLLLGNWVVEWVETRAVCALFGVRVPSVSLFNYESHLRAQIVFDSGDLYCVRCGNRNYTCRVAFPLFTALLRHAYLTGFHCRLICGALEE